MSARTWRCPECGGSNRIDLSTCDVCGQSKPGKQVAARREADTGRAWQRIGPWHCVVHGDELTPIFRCPVNERYPTQVVAVHKIQGHRDRDVVASLRCPLVCPFCRQQLDWSGGCGQCGGCMTGAWADRTFPGDRYEDDGAGHYAVVIPGPRRVATDQEATAAMVEIRRQLAVDPTHAVAEAELHLGAHRRDAPVHRVGREPGIAPRAASGPQDAD